MSNKVLKAYIWAKSVLIVLFLLFLFAIALFMVSLRPYDIIQAANAQRVRGQAIAKDALILQNSANANQWPQAISELQDIAPLWQREHASLLAFHSSNLQIAMVPVNADYIAINQALMVILAHKAPADSVQVAIILQHVPDYGVEMNQVVTLMLQDLDGIQQQIFIYCVIVYACLVALAIADPIAMIWHVRRTKKIIV